MTNMKLKQKINAIDSNPIFKKIKLIRNIKNNHCE